MNIGDQEHLICQKHNVFSYRADDECDECKIAELEAENAKLRFGLANCRLFAARHRKEDWALLILGFCAEGGVVGSITRDEAMKEQP